MRSVAHYQIAQIAIDRPLVELGFSALQAFCAGKPVNSSHKGQGRGSLLFSLIWAWINGWVNIRKAGDLTRRRAHFDVTVMYRIWQTALLWN